MTKCNTRTIDFSTCKSRLVQAYFSGGDITSDGGVVLLREIDRRLKLTESIAHRFTDRRKKKQVRHDHLSLIRQRVYGICLGLYAECRKKFHDAVDTVFTTPSRYYIQRLRLL